MNNQLNAQSAIDRGDTRIREPTGGLDGIQISLKLITGDPVARPHRHGLIGRNLETFFLWMALKPLNQDL